MQKSPQPSLKGRALRLLARREHSRAELERKLGPYEDEPGTLAHALDELTAKDLISEPRVVASVLHQRAPRMGALRIKRELQQKGVASETIADAVAGLRQTEVERAHALWRRRFDSPLADPKEHARQSRFLLGRGFAPEVVRRVLSGRFEFEEGASADNAAP
ncbi:MAG: recombination regulator RecX [Burkholderiales bacterium]